MHPRDKAALRLAIGLGLAAFIAYGLALPVPYVACVMAVLVLCKPGPPLPLLKAAVVALLFAALVAAGILMVPLLEHFAFTGVLLTARCCSHCSSSASCASRGADHGAGASRSP